MADSLTLQIKTGATWRNVMSFPTTSTAQIREGATPLAKASGHSLRICDPHRPSFGYLAYCQAPDFEWREA